MGSYCAVVSGLQRYWFYTRYPIVARAKVSCIQRCYKCDSAVSSVPAQSKPSSELFTATNSHAAVLSRNVSKIIVRHSVNPVKSAIPELWLNHRERRVISRLTMLTAIPKKECDFSSY